MTDRIFFTDGTWTGCFHWGGVVGLVGGLTESNRGNFHLFGEWNIILDSICSGTLAPLPECASAKPTFTFEFMRWESDTQYTVMSS